MDLIINFLFLVIFGIVGFVTDKICGFNLAKICSDIGAVVFILLIYSFIPREITDLNQSINNLENMLTFFVNALPGILIGDSAGTIVSQLTGEKR